MKHPKAVYLLFLLLSLSVSSRCYIDANCKHQYSSASLLYLVPERLRSVIAGILWSRADEYMHSGPSLREKKKYRAGSYAGNTELIGLLSLIIEVLPNQPQAYGVLAQNLSRHLGQFREGVRVLQYGIIHNKNAEWVNELYAQTSYTYLFDIKRTEKTLKIALKYIKAAIKKRPTSSDYKPVDLSCTLRNYLMVKSVIQNKLSIKKTDDIAANTLLKKKLLRKSKKKFIGNQMTNKHEHHHSHQSGENSHINYKVSLISHLVYSFVLLLLSISLYLLSGLLKQKKPRSTN